VEIVILWQGPVLRWGKKLTEVMSSSRDNM
jgi:hypothetical protein